MRKNYGSFFILISICIFLIAALCTPAVPVSAYKHGYRRPTTARYATVRHAISVYDSPGGTDLGYIADFTGIKVIGKEGSWYHVVYRKNKRHRLGWIIRDEYQFDCLEYDGRDKQPIADGNYLFTRMKETPSVLSGVSSLEQTEKHKLKTLRYALNLSYYDRGLYYIKNAVTGLYLSCDPSNKGARYSDGRSKPAIRWVSSKEKAGRFHLERDGNGYIILDEVSLLPLCLTSYGVPGFEQNKTDLWRAVRTGPVTEKENLRDYVQYDAEWASFHYGEGRHRKTSSNNFTTSGCGIFATINAIYSVTGHFPDPYELADYAVKHYFRIEGSGTDSGFFEAAADAFGEKYGFTFAGTSESLKTLRRRLKAGQTAVTHVPGHYVTIVDYNPNTKKYLLLDPHYLPKRKTCPYGDWVSAKTLTGDSLFAYIFFFYEKTY